MVVRLIWIASATSTSAIDQYKFASMKRKLLELRQIWVGFATKSINMYVI